MSGYIGTFKNKDGDKDKSKNNKLKSFGIYNDKQLKNVNPFELRLKAYKILNWMLVYIDKYMKIENINL